jgi:hypothetical protein
MQPPSLHSHSSLHSSLNSSLHSSLHAASLQPRAHDTASWLESLNRQKPQQAMPALTAQPAEAAYSFVISGGGGGGHLDDDYPFLRPAAPAAVASAMAPKYPPGLYDSNTGAGGARGLYGGAALYGGPPHRPVRAAAAVYGGADSYQSGRQQQQQHLQQLQHQQHLQQQQQQQQQQRVTNLETKQSQMSYLHEGLYSSHSRGVSSVSVGNAGAGGGGGSVRVGGGGGLRFAGDGELQLPRGAQALWAAGPPAPPGISRGVSSDVRMESWVLGVLDEDDPLDPRDLARQPRGPAAPPAAPPADARADFFSSKSFFGDFTGASDELLLSSLSDDEQELHEQRHHHHHQRARK